MEQQTTYPSFLLPHPKTKKLSRENKVIEDMEIGHSSMQGYRTTMEDQHVINTMSALPNHVLVAIMDGHAGTFAAELTSLHLKPNIEETDEWKEYLELAEDEREKNPELLGRALVQSFINLDEELRSLKELGMMADESGCTLVCAIITPSHIVCANVGDSRCVLGCKTKTVPLTDDHKPSLPEEKKRIEAAGGVVQFDRVNGELAMSRAIGDFRYKVNNALEIHEQLVICHPDIAIQRRNQREDEVLILACDGVWDVISNEEAVTYVSNIVLNNEGNSDNKKLVNRKTISSLEAAESLIDLALKDGSTDNISAIVVKFFPK